MWGLLFLPEQCRKYLASNNGLFFGVFSVVVKVIFIRKLYVILKMYETRLSTIPDLGR
jgi:hypothetical protein